MKEKESESVSASASVSEEGEREIASKINSVKYLDVIVKLQMRF